MYQHTQLPLDVFVEILTLLPVKTLVRFRSVSKSWDVLIQSPNFVSLHLRRQSADIDKERVLISLNPNLSRLCKCLDDPDKGLCAGNAAIDGVAYNKGNKVVGSCNGLVCVLGVRRNFLLMNPSTGKCREVSIHKPSLISELVWVGIVGFGYEHAVDDYKIVQASPLRSDEYPSYGDSVEALIVVITIGRNTVKRFKNRMPFIPFQVGRQVGGKLHWVESHLTGAGKERHRLLSFDLKTDEFEQRVLPFPDHQDGTSSSIRCGASGVSVVHGQLCVVLTYGVNFVPHKLDLWVREVQGVYESWTKKFSFLPERSCFPSFWMNPLCFSKNGGLFMKLEDGLMVYDLKEEKYMKVVYGGSKAKWSCAEVYVESLLSPYHVPFANQTQWSWSI